MFFDFNISYSGPNSIPCGERAGIMMSHLVNIPARIVSTVVELAKLIFFTIFAALSFGQSDYMNGGVRISANKLAISSAGIGISIIGIFAPVNALTWQAQVTGNIIMNDFKDMFNGKNMDAYKLQIALNAI